MRGAVWGKILPPSTDDGGLEANFRVGRTDGGGLEANFCLHRTDGGGLVAKFWVRAPAAAAAAEPTEHDIEPTTPKPQHAHLTDAETPPRPIGTFLLVDVLLISSLGATDYRSRDETLRSNLASLRT